jgi:hypothetical protein
MQSLRRQHEEEKEGSANHGQEHFVGNMGIPVPAVAGGRFPFPHQAGALAAYAM